MKVLMFGWEYPPHVFGGQKTTEEVRETKEKDFDMVKYDGVRALRMQLVRHRPIVVKISRSPDFVDAA